MTRQINPSLSFFQSESFGAPAAQGFRHWFVQFLGGGPRGTGVRRLHAGENVSALDALQRESDRIRLQSRHWLM